MLTFRGRPKEELETFAAACARNETVWEEAIAEAQAADPGMSRSDIENMLVQAGEKDLAQLEEEKSSMVVRTNIIVATSTLLFAAIALKPGASKTVWAVVTNGLYTAAIMATAAALIISVWALCPPFSRAWKHPYDDRFVWNSQLVNNFTKWARHCWLGNRRKPVITQYKKAHSVAIPLLTIGLCLATPGIALNILLR